MLIYRMAMISYLLLQYDGRIASGSLRLAPFACVFQTDECYFDSYSVVQFFGCASLAVYLERVVAPLILRSRHALATGESTSKRMSVLLISSRPSELKRLIKKCNRWLT
jgi:hypothetical protein